jgi:hypothetical protein
LIFVAGSRAPHAAPEIHAAFSAKEQATGVVSSRPLCLGNGWGRGGAGWHEWSGSNDKGALEQQAGRVKFRAQILRDSVEETSGRGLSA